MLKRGPIIVIGIIVLVLLATPYAIGMINENAMQREVERISAAGLFETRIADYDRGWFDTRARVEVGINPNYLATIMGGEPDPMMMMMFGGFTLPVIIDVAHGPVLFDDGLGVGTAAVHAYVDPASDLAMLAEQFLGMPYVFDFRGRGSFGNGFRYEREVPPVDLALPDVSVTSTGITFSGLYQRGSTDIEAELANISLQSPFASGILESLRFTSNTKRSSPTSLPIGAVVFALARVSFSDPLQGAAASFAIENAGFRSSIEEDETGEMVGLEAVYSVDRVSVPNQFELSDAELGIRLTNVDRQTAEEFYQLSQQLSGSQMSDPNAVIAALDPIAARLIAGKSEILLDPVQFSMNGGSFDGSVTLAINPAALPTGSLSDLQDQAVAMRALSASIEVEADKSLVQNLAAMFMPVQNLTNPDGTPMTPEQIQAQQTAQLSLILLALSAQGMLVDSGTAYSSSIRLENGALTANGQPLPLPL